MERRNHHSGDHSGVVRVRMPKGKEMLGTVLEVLGSSRFRIDCNDGKERICRVPGKLRRSVWVKVGDIVIISPWDIQEDERGDVIWRYTPAQVNWLLRNGKLKR